jgi:hypothetical protein
MGRFWIAASWAEPSSKRLDEDPDGTECRFRRAAKRAAEPTDDRASPSIRTGSP